MSQPESRTGSLVKSRAPARLNTILDRNLLAYAAAASAAGVSLLALAQPAGAKIVYTKANVEIAPRTKLFLSLVHDQGHDFEFRDRRDVPGSRRWNNELVNDLAVGAEQCPERCR